MAGVETIRPDAHYHDRRSADEIVLRPPASLVEATAQVKYP
jgi:hypothetical protein